MSGYSACPCRDCFEIAMDGDLCGSCEDAGCSESGDSECDSPCAYGGCSDPTCCDSEAA